MDYHEIKQALPLLAEHTILCDWESYVFKTSEQFRTQYGGSDAELHDYLCREMHLSYPEPIEGHSSKRIYEIDNAIDIPSILKEVFAPTLGGRYLRKVLRRAFKGVPTTSYLTRPWYSLCGYTFSVN